MTDKEIIQELTDQLDWYESQEKKLLKQMEDNRRMIAKNKRLIQLFQADSNKEGKV